MAVAWKAEGRVFHGSGPPRLRNYPPYPEALDSDENDCCGLLSRSIADRGAKIIFVTLRRLMARAKLPPTHSNMVKLFMAPYPQHTIGGLSRSICSKQPERVCSLALMTPSRRRISHRNSQHAVRLSCTAIDALDRSSRLRMYGSSPSGPSQMSVHTPCMVVAMLETRSEMVARLAMARKTCILVRAHHRRDWLIVLLPLTPKDQAM